MLDTTDSIASVLVDAGSITCNRKKQTGTTINPILDIHDVSLKNMTIRKYAFTPTRGLALDQTT